MLLCAKIQSGGFKLMQMVQIFNEPDGRMKFWDLLIHCLTEKNIYHLEWQGKHQ
jgi:hypothetical protein